MTAALLIDSGYESPPTPPAGELSQPMSPGSIDSLTDDDLSHTKARLNNGASSSTQTSPGGGLPAPPNPTNAPALAAASTPVDDALATDPALATAVSAAVGAEEGALRVEEATAAMVAPAAVAAPPPGNDGGSGAAAPRTPAAADLDYLDVAAATDEALAAMPSPRNSLEPPPSEGDLEADFDTTTHGAAPDAAFQCADGHNKHYEYDS